MHKRPIGKIEKKWSDKWVQDKTYEPNITTPKKPYYNLMMFPYPSAEGLHVGNMYAFTGSDVFGRFMRMQGYDVLEPIGLDGFGIHSENYAIKNNVHPKNMSKKTQENFYRQLKSIGNGFAWDHKLETYDPNYYKWTQWIFIKMFEKGLAYQEQANVNWCPSCKTVLSDEQVEKVTLPVIPNSNPESGASNTRETSVCERCKSEVEQKSLKQWFFKITDYADELIDDLDKVDWEDKIKTIQTNWIGKSTGVEIDFELANPLSPVIPTEEASGNEVEGSSEANIRAYTTRPDTIEGVTFMVIAPEHPLVSKILNDEILSSKDTTSHSDPDLSGEEPILLLTKEQKQKIKQYVESTKLKSEQDRIINKEKTGVDTGLTCINPATNEQIPIWIADYVLMDYGTGAVMGVPFSDERDHEFATRFGLKIKEHGEYKEKIGQEKTNYKLRDWCISRQRYWGPPIPIIHCEKCGQVAVPVEDLPVLLPDTNDYLPTNDGLSPLARNQEFVNTKCPKCGGQAKRDTDVSDTFLDSSWYFLFYPSIKTTNASHSDPPNPPAGGGGASESSPQTRHSELVSESSPQTRHSELVSESSAISTEAESSLPWNSQITNTWLPVDKYIGGAEHAVLHLLYSRFITKALRDFGYLNFDEPFTNLRAHGLIIKDGAKMSKSKGNVINPDEYINRFGADTLRTYLMFMGPLSQGGDFRDNGLLGIHRFLNRVWEAMNTRVGSKTSKELTSKLHITIKKATTDIPKLKYNTAIASCMEFLNLLEEDKSYTLSKEDAISYLKLLAPFAPFMTEELYQTLKSQTKSVYPVIPTEPALGGEAETRPSGKRESLSAPSHSELACASRFISESDFASIHLQPWPTYDNDLTIDDNVEIPIQVNGKLRGTISVNRDTSQDEVVKIALKNDKVKTYITSEPKKVIFIPNKMINFVV